MVGYKKAIIKIIYIEPLKANKLIYLVSVSSIATLCLLLLLLIRKILILQKQHEKIAERK